MRFLPLLFLFACAPAVSELQLAPRTATPAPTATDPMPTDATTTKLPPLDRDRPTALRTATFALG